jgi:hypothetical protein
MKRKVQHVKLRELQDPIVTIIYGESSVNVFAEQLRAYLYSTAKEKSDISLMGTLKKAYYNAFEWILANLYRIIGVQLYDDGEIRLNINPSQIVNGEKCILLKLDEIKDRSLDNSLYICLIDLIYGKPEGNMAN